MPASAPGSDPGSRVVLVAGEASGDALGAGLIAAIRQQAPRMRFEGIGGPRMAAAGLVLWHRSERLAVRGYVEVLGRLREILAIRRDVRSRMLADRPDAFIGIDAPDFNLGLERRMRRAGIPVVHYVSPSIWAWRAGRIARIKQSVDLMLALFPFEQALYEAAGIPVSVVGHPLADAIPEQVPRERARSDLRLAPDGPIVALLPGSRVAEVEHHAELFLQTARRITERLPGVRFLVPLVSRETREIFESRLYETREVLRLTMLFGHAQDAIAAADVVLVASGTATLETALLRRPMVITYRMPGFSWWLTKRRMCSPYFGLPNILAGEYLVPEIMQEDATPENLAQALLNLFADAEVRRRLDERFAGIGSALRLGASARAAHAIMALLDHRRDRVHGPDT
jgi:lipid-A-disaccharide synthase